MARPREFDRGEVLDIAMELFWKRGYEGTSLQDLVDGMGINRASLYDTFGNKDALFAEAMDRYAQETERRVLSLLREPGPPRRVLREFFRFIVDALVEGRFTSCLVLKTAMTRGQEDAATADRCACYNRAVENAFHDLLVRARKEGDLAPGRSPRALARFLSNSLAGLNATAAVRRDRKLLRDVVRTTLAALD